MSFSQGASTLTQQVLKNEVLDNEKSISRKIKEQYLAVSLENALKKQLGSKDAAKKYILELYLNTIPLHHGLRGVEAASQYYFGKHASELTAGRGGKHCGHHENPQSVCAGYESGGKQGTPDDGSEKNAGSEYDYAGGI